MSETMTGPLGHLDISSYAAALGQVDTCKLFPNVPAVLAAKVPTVP